MKQNKFVIYQEPLEPIFSLAGSYAYAVALHPGIG